MCSKLSQAWLVQLVGAVSAGDRWSVDLPPHLPGGNINSPPDPALISDSTFVKNQPTINAGLCLWQPHWVCVYLCVTLALLGLWELNIKLWNEKFRVFRLSYLFENFFHYSEPCEFLWVLRCRCQFLSKRCWDFDRSHVKPVGQVSSLGMLSHPTHEADSVPFIYIYFKHNKATWFLAYKSCWLVL